MRMRRQPGIPRAAGGGTATSGPLAGPPALPRQATSPRESDLCVKQTPLPTCQPAGAPASVGVLAATVCTSFVTRPSLDSGELKAGSSLAGGHANGGHGAPLTRQRAAQGAASQAVQQGCRAASDDLPTPYAGGPHLSMCEARKRSTSVWLTMSVMCHSGTGPSGVCSPAAAGWVRGISRGPAETHDVKPL